MADCGALEEEEIRPKLRGQTLADCGNTGIKRNTSEKAKGISQKNGATAHTSRCLTAACRQRPPSKSRTATALMTRAARSAVMEDARVCRVFLTPVAPKYTAMV